MAGIIAGIQQIGIYQRLIAGSTAAIWMGRGVEMIKAGSDTASPYFQHRLIAAISVLVWTAMTWMVLFSSKGRMIMNWTIIKCLPQQEVEVDSRRLNRMKLGWTLVLGTGLLSAGFFSKFVCLPLSTIVALSIVTFLGVKYKDQFKFRKKHS